MSVPAITMNVVDPQLAAAAAIPRPLQPHPLRLERRQPALNPLAAPFPALVTIADSCALVVEACYTLKHGKPQDLISALAGTGRANTFIAAHVPGELLEHLPRVAAHYHVPPDRALRLLAGGILPVTRAVDLEIRDHLAPRTRHLLRDDPELPRRHRGDPDDAPTMALAELLAPAVIVTQDSVFARFGLAVDPAQWIETAQGMLRAVGFEASYADALVVTELALRLAWEGAASLVTAARRHTVLTLAGVAAALWLAHRAGYLDRVRWRSGAAKAYELAQPLLQRFGEAALDHIRVRDALIVVDPPAFPTPEQLAARHLARCGCALTPAQLRDALAYEGHRIPATQLKRAMTAHRGFTRLPGDLYTIGRLPQLPRTAPG